MEIEYVWNGDFMIPNLKAPDTPDEMIGKFGRMREKYLKDHKIGLYTAYITSGKLYQHLLEIDHQAKERKAAIVKKMKEAEGVDQKMQKEHCWEYLQKLQTIELEADQIVLDELVYV